MVKCEIRFDDNPYGIYYSGEQVTGKVEITLPKQKNVQAIILNIYGRAKTRWSERNMNNDTYDSYGGKEKYLDSQTFLIGSPGGATITLNPGIQTFNFSSRLPLMLPSSFEGKHGSIRYLVKVILKRPWKFDQTHVVGFTVLRKVDLNFEEPSIRLPFEKLASKFLRSGFCNSKPFMVYIIIPQAGFVPGQKMPVTLCMQNDTSTNVDNFQLNFKRIVTFRTENLKHSIVQNDYLSKKNYGSFGRYSKKTIFHEIRIPPVPPSSKKSCSIITIAYEIEVVVNFGWFHRKFYAYCPVTIGTVPLSSVIQNQPVAVAEFELVEGRISDVRTPISDPLRRAPIRQCSFELRPPSYEEAVFMNRVTLSDEDEHPMEKSQFLPRYPVYTFDDKSIVHQDTKRV